MLGSPCVHDKIESCQSSSLTKHFFSNVLVQMQSSFNSFFFFFNFKHNIQKKLASALMGKLDFIFMKQIYPSTCTSTNTFFLKMTAAFRSLLPRVALHYWITSNLHNIILADFVLYEEIQNECAMQEFPIRLGLEYCKKQHFMKSSLATIADNFLSSGFPAEKWLKLEVVFLIL